MRALGRLFLVISAGLVIAALGVVMAARSARRRVVQTTDPAANEVSLAAIFGPLEFASTAPSFRGGKLECWLGGGEVDLRGATLDPAGAHLRVMAVMGGGEIIVPEGWVVRTSLTGFAGAVGDARPPRDRPADAPVLEISGRLIMAGFAITSEPHADEPLVVAESAGVAHDAAQGSDAPTDAPAEPETLEAALPVT